MNKTFLNSSVDDDDDVDVDVDEDDWGAALCNSVVDGSDEGVVAVAAGKIEWNPWAVGSAATSSRVSSSSGTTSNTGDLDLDLDFVLVLMLVLEKFMLLSLKKLDSAFTSF